MGDIAIAQNAPVVKKQTKNQENTSRLKEQKRETDLNDFYSNMRGSIFVNGFATPRSGTDFSQVPARPSLRTGPMIQRSCKGDSTCSCSECSKNSESGSADTAGNEEMSLQESAPESEQSVERSPVAETSQAPAETTDVSGETEISAEQSTTSLIAEDNANDLTEGQMKKTEFLQQVRSGICGAIEPILATKGQTTDGCPYLNYWLDLYQQKDVSEIESTAKRYVTGSSSARTAQDYIALIVQRATRSAEVWASTGRLSGIPEGVPTTLPNEAASSANTQTPAVQAKAKNGAAKKVDDPLAIQSELGNGNPLEGSVRSRMESAFGMNFSHVRAHTDANASELSNRVNARAFTVGNHVAFGSGEYKPGTILGDALIAHELAHTIQQSGSENSVDKMEVGTAGYNQLENDADQSAMGVVSNLWSEAKEGLKGMADRTLPMLRSGLKIQRCKSDTSTTTTASGATTKNTDGVDLGPTDINKMFCRKGNFSEVYKVGQNTASAATGSSIIKFEGENGTKKDSKECSCDCGYLRQYIKGYWRTSAGGDKKYDVDSCGRTITMNETTWVEEHMDCDPQTNKCKQEYTDNPGWSSGLSDGNYIELIYDFKFELWDKCQGKAETTTFKKLTLKGDKAPRTIDWS